MGFMENGLFTYYYPNMQGVGNLSGDWPSAKLNTSASSKGSLWFWFLFLFSLENSSTLVAKSMDFVVSQTRI